MQKERLLTSDLFKGKKIVSVVSDHPLFSDPAKAVSYRKVFPSIGLKNFVEEVNIDKCLIDLKKEGSYVLNLLRVMSDYMIDGKNQLISKADQMRYLEVSREKRIANASRLEEIYECAHLMSNFAYACDPSQPEVREQVIIPTNGKIELKLHQDLFGLKINSARPDPSFKKGFSLIKLYARLRDRAAELGIELPILERLPEKKIFDKENMPNKRYQIIFSSDGKEGAWDLLTMSMRGLRSCQSWESDYPQCLIGSIVSKFVGIIYLTSGIMAEAHENWSSLGTKMLKRCLVRYIYDRELNNGQGGPVLLLDRLYPDKDNPDRDILKLFMDKLAAKSKLPIYYGPDLKNKPGRLRNLYTPNDGLLQKILHRERSYQDTPLRSKQEFDLQLLFALQAETRRHIKPFSAHLTIFIASKLNEVYTRKTLSPDLQRLINSIRLHTSFTSFAQLIVSDIMKNYTPPVHSMTEDSKSYYRVYLRKLFSERHQIKEKSRDDVLNTIIQHSPLDDDKNMIEPALDYLFGLVCEFIKLQLAKPYFQNSV